MGVGQGSGGGGSAAGQVVSLERTGSERRRVYVPLKRRAARFLEVLATCGNATMAAEAAGIGRDRLYRHRRENCDFAADWARAREAFEARAEADDALEAEGLDEEAIDREGMVVRRGRDGVPQMVRRRSNMWSKAKEEAFFGAFEATACVTAASRAAGMSAKAGFERLRTNAAFHERVIALKGAYDSLELRLIAERARAAGGRGPGEARPRPRFLAASQPGAVGRRGRRRTRGAWRRAAAGRDQRGSRPLPRQVAGGLFEAGEGAAGRGRVEHGRGGAHDPARLGAGGEPLVAGRRGR
jgi:hypothetical protein